MIESRASSQGGAARNGLREFIGFLRRRKLIILASTLLIPAATWAIVSTIPHRYTAEAALALDARKVQIVEHEVVSGLPQESPVVRTELDVISSRSLIEKVIDRLDLMHNRDLLREAEAQTSQLRGLFLAIQNGLSRLLPGTGTLPENHAALTRAQLIDWLIDHLKVSNDGRSFTIIISFTSQDPRRAAEITNAVAEQYLSDQVQTKASTTARANKWLGEKLKDLRRQVEISAAAVDDFRRRTGLIEAKGSTIPAQRLAELNTQLINVRLERARAEAKLQAARDGDPASAPEVLASPVVQELRKDIARNDGKIAEERYNSLSYRSNVLQARSMALHNKLNVETNRILASLVANVRAARKNEAALMQSFENIEAQLGDTTRSATRLGQLQLEADADRSVYETFLSRYKQTMEQGGLEAPDARLISEAAPPALPSYPKKLELVVVAVFAGLAVGMGLGYVREGFDRRIRQASDIGAVAGIPIFGLIPKLSKWRFLPPQDHPVSRPHSPFCTSLVRIRVALQAPASSAGCKVIFVTSAKAGEGKTSFCTSLARSLAASFARVLVIDADPYRPRVATAFGAPSVPNLMAVIDNHARLSDAVQIDTKSLVHFITGPGERDLQLIIRSGDFAALIEEARKTYDTIILDTPPVTTSPDAAVIGGLADTCLFLVRWGRTSWDEVNSAVGFLRLCGIKPDGVVMVGVDAQAASYGAIGDYGYAGVLPVDDIVTSGRERRPVTLRGSEPG